MIFLSSFFCIYYVEKFSYISVKTKSSVLLPIRFSLNFQSSKKRIHFRTLSYMCTRLKKKKHSYIRRHKVRIRINQKKNTIQMKTYKNLELESKGFTSKI